MNCLLSITVSQIMQDTSVLTFEKLILAVTPENSITSPEAYGPPALLDKVSRQQPTYLMLNEQSEDIILSQLNSYASTNFLGVLPTFIKNAADIEQLHAILAVFEAKNGLREEALKILPEFGKHPAAFNNLTALAGKSPRLTAITWNENTLKAALDGKRTRDNSEALLPPYQFAQTQCLLAAKAARLKAIDSAGPATSPEIRNTINLGFDAKAAGTSEQAKLVLQTYNA